MANRHSWIPDLMEEYLTVAILNQGILHLPLLSIFCRGLRLIQKNLASHLVGTANSRALACNFLKNNKAVFPFDDHYVIIEIVFPRLGRKDTAYLEL